MGRKPHGALLIPLAHNAFDEPQLVAVLEAAPFNHSGTSPGPYLHDLAGGTQGGCALPPPGQRHPTAILSATRSSSRPKLRRRPRSNSPHGWGGPGR